MRFSRITLNDSNRGSLGVGLEGRRLRLRGGGDGKGSISLAL
jgi:hypothetical protein